MKIELIGLLGNQGVGKNYIADILMNQSDAPTLILSFADHFKVDCVCKHEMEYNKIFHKKDNETRKKLQKIGTEEGRNVYGENIWIKITETWIKTFNLRGITRFIIPDVRFQNEVDWIKSLGGKVIKIQALCRYKERLHEESGGNQEEINKILNHVSEKGVDEISNYDIIINNDPDDNLEEQLKNIKL